MIVFPFILFRAVGPHKINTGTVETKLEQQLIKKIKGIRSTEDRHSNVIERDSLMGTRGDWCET